MNPQLVITADGSPTLYVDEWQEHYHSMHGAVQESRHVFIQAGLIPASENSKQLQVLEIGLGTGLNALLTFDYALKNEMDIRYTALEPFPLSTDILSHFAPEHLIALESGATFFQVLHQAAWETEFDLHPQFHLLKIKTMVQHFMRDDYADLIYYDAFSPRVQPDMWTIAIFQQMFKTLKPKGILVTYCAKGDVRRALLNAGFKVERMQGPPGKREMLRGIKM